MNKTDLENYTSIIENNIEKDLKVITSIVYKYDVEKMLEGLNKLSIKEQDEVVETCINNCLKEIQLNILSQEQYKKINRDVDEIIDFYDDDNHEEMIEEADCVAYDLIMKVIGHNGRKFELPISIDYIRNYCIHNMIKQKDIRLTVLFILLELFSVCYCIRNKNYTIENN